LILVTGGTGFLGRNLLPILLDQQFRVRVVTRYPQRYDWLHKLDVEVFTGDVRDREAMFEAAQGCEYVIHAAGKFRFWGNQEQFRSTNVDGARNVMDAALQVGVKKFIHISTVVVVGTPQNEDEIDEAHPTNPADGYQRSKLEGEHLALQHHKENGLPVVILRPGAFYGPYGRYAFNKMFFEDPLRGLPMGVANGEYYTFPAYIKDVSHAIILALEHGRPGEIYNICSQYLTHREVDDIIAEEAGISRFHLYFPAWLMVPFAQLLSLFGVLFGSEPYYPITLRSYILNDWKVSSQKAIQELGFCPTPFRDGVRETLQWYRQIGIWTPKD
jgi:nucleoside-diphosphate-sugar epimerase